MEKPDPEGSYPVTANISAEYHRLGVSTTPGEVQSYERPGILAGLSFFLDRPSQIIPASRLAAIDNPSSSH